LIKEGVASIDDPNFDKMSKYYTRYNASKSLFNKLNDQEKVNVINYVDAVVNGGNREMRHPSQGFPSKSQDTITTMLATEIVRPNEEVDGWKPDSVNIQNMYNFLLKFYSPYSGSDSGIKNNVSFRAASQIPHVDPQKVDIDIVIDSFTHAIKELLVDKKYDPNFAPFDYVFVNMAWRNDIDNLSTKIKKRRNIGVDPMMKTGEGDEEEEIDVTYTYGKSDPEMSLVSDSDKFKIILDQFNDDERKILQGFYNFIFSETRNEEQAATKLIDVMSDKDGDVSEIEPDDISSNKSKEGMYDFIAKEFNMENTERTYGYLKNLVSRLKPKMVSLFRNPRFKELMGIEDWSEKNLEILKGTGSKGKEWKKRKDLEKDLDVKSIESEFQPKSGIAYDEFGKPLPVDDKGRIIPKSKRNISEIMMECVFDIENNFRYRLSKINNNLDKINKINYYLNEGYDVALKDLDQDIYQYLNNAVDGLEKANYMLNELEGVSNDIKFEYPEVSEKIAEFVNPLTEEIFNLLNKVKNVKKMIHPFLSESTSKKKTEPDDDQLEEERITNPESKNFVKNRENFIGSHIYGEDLGGLGKMYVAYSYGEQYPAYLWYNDKWYHNTSNYVLDDGTVNEPTNQHKIDMRPVQDTHGLSTFALNTMINKFKKKHGLGDNVHTDVEPGEKN
jgi:hypothetical protein